MPKILFLIFLLLFPSFALGETTKFDQMQAKKLGNEDIPTNLIDIINQTLLTHESMNIFQENLDAAHYEYKRAKSGYFPRIDAEGKIGYATSSTPATRSAGTQNSWGRSSEIQVKLVQPIWDGFATRSRTEVNQALYDAVDYRLLDNAISLITSVIETYTNLITLQDNLEIAKNHTLRHQEILELAQARFKAGASQASDVSQVEGRLARALAIEADLESSNAEARAIYTRITGLEVPKNLTALPVPTYMYTDYTEVIDEALLQNPRLLSYKTDIKQMQGEKDLARSNYSPVINFETGPYYAEYGNKRSYVSSFDAMITMRWTIFNSGATKNLNKAAESRVRQANSTALNYRDDLTLQAENLWYAYTNAKNQNIHYSNAINYNKATLDSYTEQFLLLQRSLVDLLDAESELFNSTLQANIAKGSIIINAYRLYALSGSILKNFVVESNVLYGNQ